MNYAKKYFRILAVLCSTQVYSGFRPSADLGCRWPLCILSVVLWSLRRCCWSDGGPISWDILCCISRRYGIHLISQSSVRLKWLFLRLDVAHQFILQQQPYGRVYLSINLKIRIWVRKEMILVKKCSISKVNFHKVIIEINAEAKVIFVLKISRHVLGFTWHLS
jgi:hypothetical protein